MRYVLALLALLPPCAVAAAPATLTPADYHRLLGAAHAAYARAEYAAAESSFARLAAADGRDVLVWTRLGQSGYRLGHYAEAIEAFEHAQALGTDRIVEGSAGLMAYRVARCKARLGDRPGAIAALRRALVLGFEDRQGIAEEAAFDTLKRDPAFGSIIGALPARMFTRDQGWRYDLAFLVAEIRRVHVRWRREPLPTGFEAAVRSLDRRIPSLSDARIALELQALMARLGDGHTVLYPGGERVQLPAIPIQTWHFSDGWFVVSAPDSLAALRGRRLLSIGGVPMDTLAARLGPWVSRDNPVGIEWLGPLYLRIGAMVAALGGAPSGTSLRLTLVDATGATSDVTLPCTTALHPSVPKLAAWSAAGAAEAPLWLRDVSRPFWTAQLPSSRALYVQFNQVADADSESLEAFGLRLRAILARDSIRDLVVDVRHNNGGDGTLLYELVRTLVAFDAADPHHRLFVITGRNTFSAAQVFINRLAHGTGAVFVGEPSSSRPDFAGEETPLRLPWSGMHGSISSRLHMVDGADARQWIAPTVPVALASADYFANRDPALEAVLELMHDAP